MENLVFFATSWSAQSGGINSLNYDLCLALAEMGVHITCVVEKLEGDTAQVVNSAINVIYGGGSYADCDKWLQTLLDEKFDEIGSTPIWIGHDAITGGAALIAKKLRGGTAVIFQHMDYSNYHHLKTSKGKTVSSESKIATQNSLVRDADIVFGVGPRLLASAKKLRDSKKATYVFEPGRPLRQARFSKIFDYRIAVSGRLTADDDPVKNISPAVRGAAQVLAKLESKRGSLSLIGAEPPKGVNYLSGLPRAAAVNYIPYLVDRDAYFNELTHCDILLMPSLKDGFGLVAWEAACLGIPVILSKSTGFYQLLQESGYAEHVTSFAATGIALIDEGSIKKLIEIVIDNYEKKRADAALLARFLEPKTWVESARRFNGLLAGISSSDETDALAVEKSNITPPSLPLLKKAERPKPALFEKDANSGTFERFEDLLSLNFKRRSLVIPKAESRDSSKGQKIRFEFWRVHSPNEQFFLYLAPSANIAQSIGRLSARLKEQRLSPEQIVVVRRDRGDASYLQKIFKTHNLDAKLIEYSVKQYVWEYCIEDGFKRSLNIDSPLNYVDQPLVDSDDANNSIQASARNFLIEKICGVPDSSAKLVIGGGGMGKTWLCMSLANELPRRLREDSLVVLIRAEDIRSSFADVGLSHVQIRTLYDLYELYGRATNLQRSHDRFTFDLAVLSGNIVVIIDGLDELSTILQERFDLACFLESLRELSLNLGSSQILLTTRDNLLVQQNDIDAYQIKKYDLLGFSHKDLMSYSAKRFRGLSNASDLGLRLSRIVNGSGLGDRDNRVIPFLADVVCNILEEEAARKNDADFDLTVERTPYASNNDTIDRIIHSIFRREIRRQGIDIDVKELVLNLSEIISLHGERIDNSIWMFQFQVLYGVRAQDLFKRVSLNPLFRVSGAALQLKYDFLQSYFRAVYVIDCLIGFGSHQDALNALAKVNAAGCPELDYIRKYFAGNGDELEGIITTMIPKLRAKVTPLDIEDVAAAREAEIARRAMSALLKIYSMVRGLNGARFSESILELFEAPSKSGKKIDGLNLFGDFPALDLTGVTVINSNFVEYKKFPRSKVVGAHFLHCTFERCAETGFVDESFGMARFDQNCVLGDIGKVIQTAKSKIDVSQKLLEDDALSFLRSFFKRGVSYDPKKSWINFSTRVDG